MEFSQIISYTYCLVQWSGVDHSPVSSVLPCGPSWPLYLLSGYVLTLYSITFSSTWKYSLLFIRVVFVFTESINLQMYKTLTIQNLVVTNTCFNIREILLCTTNLIYVFLFSWKCKPLISFTKRLVFMVLCVLWCINWFFLHQLD